MSFRSNQIADLWITGSEEWMHSWWALGFKPYFITVTFHPLRGGRDQIREQMRKAIENWLGPKLLTCFCHHPRAPGEQWRLPKIILFADMPVWKHMKGSIRQFLANDGGLHYQGFLLVSPLYWMRKGCPIRRIEQKQHVLAREGIARVHLQEIDDEAGIADYAVKAIKWNLEAENHIIAFPRPVDDMKVAHPISPEEKALKDMQSSMNVSEDLAKALLAHK